MNQLSDKYEFEVQFLPFELNPQLPPEGIDYRKHLTQKFGGTDRYDQLTKHVSEIASAEGLAFNLDKQSKSPNTRNAHRLLWLAQQEGIQPAVKEAFMQAFFTDGVDLTQLNNLVAVAQQAGLDESKARQLLASDEGIAEVTFAEQLNHQRGISGVPFFIVNDQYGISGAQPTDTWLKVIEEIAEVAVNE